MSCWKYGWVEMPKIAVTSRSIMCPSLGESQLFAMEWFKNVKNKF